MVLNLYLSYLIKELLPSQASPKLESVLLIFLYLNIVFFWLPFTLLKHSHGFDLDFEILIWLVSLVAVTSSYVSSTS